MSFGYNGYNEIYLRFCCTQRNNLWTIGDVWSQKISVYIIVDESKHACLFIQMNSVFMIIITCGDIKLTPNG